MLTVGNADERWFSRFVQCGGMLAFLLSEILSFSQFDAEYNGRLSALSRPNTHRHSGGKEDTKDVRKDEVGKLVTCSLQSISLSAIITKLSSSLTPSLLVL